MAHHRDDTDIFDRGLAFELSTLMERRTMLRLMGGGWAARHRRLRHRHRGHHGAGGATTTSGATGTTGAATGEVCADEIPEKTAGSFPDDGSNGPKVLTESEIVRSDITASFGSSSTRARGSRSPSASPSRTPPLAASRSPAPPSICGSATARAVTRSTPTG